MKNESILRRIVSTFLVLCFVVTVISVTAFANTESGTEGQVVNEKTVAEYETGSASPSVETVEFSQYQAMNALVTQSQRSFYPLTGTYLLLNSSGEGQDKCSTGYLQFQVNSEEFTSNDHILSAKLSFYAKKTMDSDTPSDALRVSRIDGENEDWNPSKAVEPPAIGEQIGLLSNIEKSEDLLKYEVDITSYFQGIADQALSQKKVTFVLQSNVFADETGIYVATKETEEGLQTEGYTSTKIAPKLTVEYIKNTGNGSVSDIPQSEEDLLAEPTATEFESIDAAWKESEAEKILYQATMEGSGTVSDPYLIFTADDLRSMTENDNKCYKLMNDIDLEGKPWRPVGYYYWYPFMGYLDGNGYKITNLFVGGTGDDAWDINAGGLFGFLEGRVENLGVETVKAQRKGIDFAGTAGGIAGVANAPAEISNCYFNGYVAGAFSAGGITGIAYPGTMIENCAAIGTVDMSQLFEYRFDNSWQKGKDIFNGTCDIVIFIAQKVEDLKDLEKTWEKWVQGFKAFISTAELISDLTSGDYATEIRKCNVGGLVGLNYGAIDHSYAATELLNVETGIASSSTKVGAIVARNMGEGQVTNCAFDVGKAEEIDGNFKSRGKTKEQLIGWFANSDQWNCSSGVLSQASTEGYPLPVINYVERSKRYGKTANGDYVAKNGEKVEYEPEIYYNSRVLMRTRPDYVIGDETDGGAIACSVCMNLDADSKHRAVTGVYQRGTVSRPYHVHDIDSLLAMQDSKESHFILCDDIDFLVSDGINTVQKYWWPVGKTHFSPGKGSLKGNLSVDENYISALIRAKEIKSEEQRFAIKNLTVQSNRNAGFFACLRGTFSDVNIELSSGTWKNWKSGVKGYHNNIVGISCIAEDASGGAVAGDTNAGALIRDCRIGGKNSAKALSFKNKEAYVEGSLRAGGVVGLLNRGAVIEGCETAVIANTRNYAKHFEEDQWQSIMNMAKAYGNATINAIDSVTDFVETLTDASLSNFDFENATRNEQRMAIKNSRINETKVLLGLGMDLLKGMAAPVYDLYYERYGNVCTGGLAGDAYGTAKNSTVYKIKDEVYYSWFWHNDVFGRANYGSEQKNIAVKTLQSLRTGINGLGTEEEPILVSTPDDLNRIADMMAEGEDFEGIYIKQTNDITLLEDFECMGLSSKTSFKGVYDGDGNQIHNLRIVNRQGAALFYRLDGGTVCDLIINNGCFVAPVAAPLAIEAVGISIISDCGSTSGTVVETNGSPGNANHFAAGMVGVLEDSFVANSYSLANIVSNGCDMSYTIGQMKGFSQVVQCYSAGTMNGDGLKAGIAITFDEESSFIECFYPQESGVSGFLDTTVKYKYTDFALNRAAQSRSHMKTQAFVDTLNRDLDEIFSVLEETGTPRLCGGAAAEPCILDLSTAKEWINSNPGTDYPQYYGSNNNVLVTLEQPEEGSLSLEYAYKGRNEKESWIPLPQGTNHVAKGGTIRVTVQDLPVDKEVDYWTRNGEKISMSDSKLTHSIAIHEDSVIAVVLKAGTAAEDQTRTMTVMIPENGTIDLTINDVYADEGEKASIVSVGRAEVEQSGQNEDQDVTVEEPAPKPEESTEEEETPEMGSTEQDSSEPQQKDESEEEPLIEDPDISSEQKKEDLESEENIKKEDTEEPEVKGEDYEESEPELQEEQNPEVKEKQEKFITINDEAVIFAEGKTTAQLENGETVTYLSEGNEEFYAFSVPYGAQITAEYVLWSGYRLNRFVCNDEEFSRQDIEATNDKLQFNVEKDTELKLYSETAVVESATPTSFVETGSAAPVGPGDETTFAGGDGSRTSPYLIDSIEQLRQVKHYLKSGFYFKLIKDLDFQDVYGDGTNVSYETIYGDQWVAIGTDADYFSFQGTFDGNGHKISNLQIQSSATTGLFGYCNGTIKNLKISGFDINTTGQSAGALVGELCGGGRIDQCGVENSSVVSAHNAGGIAGIVQKGGRISNAYAYDMYCSISNLLIANRAEDPLLGGGGAGNNNYLEWLNDGKEWVDTIFGYITEDNKNLKNGYETFRNLFNTDIMSDFRTATVGGAVGYHCGEMEFVWADFHTDWYEWLDGFSGLGSMYVGAVAGRNYDGVMESCVTGTDMEVGLGYDFLDDEDITVYEGLYDYDSLSLFAGVNGFRYIDGSKIWMVAKEETGQHRFRLKTLDGNLDVTAQLVDNSAVAPEDEDGDGVYDIYTPYELAYIEFEGWSSYELENDIFLKPCSECFDETGNRVFCGDGKCDRLCVDWGYWVPLCRERDQYFDGELNGNGHTIYGLDVSTNEAGGLFAYVLGSVHDLHISVEKIDAYGPAGGLAAGIFNRGSIERCSVYGRNAINGTDGWDINGGGNADGSGVGGFVGILGKDTLIKDCYTRVNVTNENFTRKFAYDWMQNVISVLDVGINAYGTYSDISGNGKDGSSAEENPYKQYPAPYTESKEPEKQSTWSVVTTIVSSVKGIGNFVCDSVLACHDSCVGGFVGESRGKIINAYSAGNVSSNTVAMYRGAFAGRLRTGTGDGVIMQKGEMVRHCYYLQKNNSITDEGAIQLTADQMEAGLDYLSGFDFVNVWKTRTNDYPTFRTETDERGECKFAGGSGTQEDPYRIETQDQFYQIAFQLGAGYYYQLENDIVLEIPGTWFGGMRQDYTDDYRIFDGHFDGNGHEIKIAYEMAAGADWNTNYAYAGLFPVVSGTITDLEVTIGKDFGEDCHTVGGLVGELLTDGRIENVAVNSQNITGEEHLGGLVGRTNKGSIVKNVIVDFLEDTGVEPDGGSCNCGLLIGRGAGSVACAYVRGNHGDGDDLFVGKESTFGTIVKEGHEEKTYYTPASDTAVQSSHCNATKVPSDRKALESAYPGFDFNHTWCIDVTKKQPALKTLASTTEADYKALLSAKGISGNGTEEEPFLIDSAEDLVSVSKLMKDNKRGFRGLYFKQTDDIDISSGSYSSIGDADVPFGGIYDGNHKTIFTRGLVFGVLDRAIVKNLNLEGPSDGAAITMGGAFVDGYGYSTGTLAGACYNSLILNCQAKFDNEVKLTSNLVSIGGLVETAVNTNLINCLVEMKKGLPASSSTGGIVGIFETNTLYDGGLIGLPNSTEAVLVNCVFHHGEGETDLTGTGDTKHDRAGNGLFTVDSTVSMNSAGIQNALDILNGATTVPSDVRREVCWWNYDSKNKEFSLSTAECTTTINAVGNIQLTRAYEVSVSGGVESWKEIPIDADNQKQFVVDLRKGMQLILKAESSDNEDAAIRWEVEGVPYDEHNPLEADSARFTVDKDMTVFVYDNHEREMNGIHVTLPEDGVTFQQYEPITVESLCEKGVQFAKEYTMGPDEIMEEDELNQLILENAQATEMYGERRVRVILEGESETSAALETTVHIQVEARDDAAYDGISASVPDGGITLKRYDRINVDTLQDKGVRFFKEYDYGPAQEISGADVSKLSCDVVLDYPAGTKDLTVVYADGERSTSCTVNVNIAEPDRNDFDHLLADLPDGSTSIDLYAGETFTVESLAEEKNITFYKVYASGISEKLGDDELQYIDFNAPLALSSDEERIHVYDATGTQTLAFRYDGRTATSGTVQVNVLDYTIETEAAGFVRYNNNSLQSHGEGLVVKNNGNASNTRKSYIKFNLEELKKDLADSGLILDSVALQYAAKVDRNLSYNKTLYLNKAAETSWTSQALGWNNAPAMSSPALSSTNVKGTAYQQISKDVTAYVKQRIGEGNTVTFGFEVNTCGGECVYIPISGQYKPKLVIQVKKLTAIRIAQNIEKTTYVQGQDLNLDGGQIELVYSDGSTLKKNMTDEGVTVTGYVKDTIGKQTVTVTFDGKSVAFDVNTVAKRQNLSLSQKLQVRYNSGVQGAGSELWIKNNGNSSTYSRRGYVQFNLSAIESLVQEKGLKVKSAKLVYQARVDRSGQTLQLTANGVSTEKSLTSCQWHSTASQNTAPALASTYGNIETFNSPSLRKIEVDVKSYITSRVASTETNTATFAFACQQTTSGALIGIPVSGSNAPQLVIELE